MSKKWLAIIFMATVIFSCKKETLAPINNIPDGSSALNHPTTATHLPITVNVDVTKPGYIIPAGFEGLSYETNILSQNSEFLNENNTTLVQLIKNLGPGVLRIGGNSSDETGWTNQARTDNTKTDVLTPTDIDRLAAFSKAVNWPVVFGLNLGNKDVASAALEAKYVNTALGNRLLAFQNGNEPDAFSPMGLRPKGYTYTMYRNEWESFYKGIKSAVPAATFAGPDVDPFDNNWIASFVQDESAKIKMIDGHYYVTGPASLASITYNDILNDNSNLTEYLSVMSSESSQHHLPFRISECNSIWGQGKPGVSDVFASSLWALDFMWAVAENHGSGINFHCGTSRFIYSAIADVNGSFTAKPEYYAMLAFKMGGVGQAIVPVSINNKKYNVSVHAAVNKDHSYSITIINKEVSNSFDMTIQLGKSASIAHIARLSAPGITSNDVSFAGANVKSDGTFTANATEKSTVHNNGFMVQVPAASAVVITVN